MADYNTPARVAAREELDSLIRRLQVLAPIVGDGCGDEDCDNCETTLQDPLLNGWVLVLEWVAGEGGPKSSFAIVPAPNMGYSHQRGVLSIAEEYH